VSSVARERRSRFRSHAQVVDPAGDAWAAALTIAILTVLAVLCAAFPAESAWLR